MSRPWPRTLSQYGTEDTYQLAAEWLRCCPSVADWGGAKGYFRRFLPEFVDYIVVDGTEQCEGQVLADLRYYRVSSAGILLRHVLDNTREWQPVLANALEAFRRRLVIVTFTPDARQTTRIDHANGYPVWHFNPEDLRGLMGDLLVKDEQIQTSHPERLYYLERPCAS